MIKAFLVVLALLVAAVAVTNAQTAIYSLITPLECQSVGGLLGGNKCFKSYPQASAIDYSDTETYCFSVGGRLPTVLASGEQQAIVYLANGGNVWLGLERVGTVFLWFQTTDGDTSSQPLGINGAFKFWSPSMPDTTANQCVISDSTKGGNWTVVSCYSNTTQVVVNTVVCEFPLTLRTEFGSGINENSIGLYQGECVGQGGYYQSSTWYCLTNHRLIPGTTLNYAAAKAFCSDYGGVVPSVQNAADNAALVALVNGSTFYLGLDTILTPGFFEYEDGTTQNTDYTNWVSGNPVAEDLGYDCVTIGSNGEWSNVPCTTLVSTIICEYLTFRPPCELDAGSTFVAPTFANSLSLITSNTMQIGFTSPVQYSAITFSFAAPAGIYNSSTYCNGAAFSPNTNYEEDYSRVSGGEQCTVNLLARFATLEALGQCFTRTSNSEYDVYSTTITISATQQRPLVRSFTNSLTSITAASISFQFARSTSVTISNVTAYGTPSPQSQVIQQQFNPENWVTTLRILTAMPWPYQLGLYPSTSTFYTRSNNYKAICSEAGEGFCVANPRSSIYCDCFYDYYNVYEALTYIDEYEGDYPYPEYTCGTPGDDCGQVFEAGFQTVSSQCTIDTDVDFLFTIGCSPAYVSPCVVEPDLYSTQFSTVVNNFCPTTVATNTVTASIVVSDDLEFDPSYFFTLGARVYFLVIATVTVGPPIVSTSLTRVDIVSGVKTVSIFIDWPGQPQSGLDLGDFHYFDDVAATNDSFVPNQVSFNFLLDGDTIDIIAPDQGQSVSVTAYITVTYENLNTDRLVHKLLKVKLLDDGSTQDLSAVAGFAVESNPDSSASSSAMSTMMVGMVAGAGGFALFAISAIVFAVFYIRRNVKGPASTSQRVLYLDNTSSNNSTSGELTEAATGTA